MGTHYMVNWRSRPVGSYIVLRIPWVTTHLKNLITCVQLEQITWKTAFSEKL